MVAGLLSRRLAVTSHSDPRGALLQGVKYAGVGHWDVDVNPECIAGWCEGEVEERAAGGLPCSQVTGCGLAVGGQFPAKPGRRQTCLTSQRPAEELVELGDAQGLPGRR